jgi:hypothetical protein
MKDNLALSHWSTASEMSYGHIKAYLHVQCEFFLILATANMAVMRSFKIPSGKLNQSESALVGIMRRQ